jgi:trehalose 6-phosphate synthase
MAPCEAASFTELAGSDEASTMRMQSTPSERRIWDAERLGTWLASVCRERSIVVLANREPLRHEADLAGRIIAKRSTGGLVTALEPLIEACSGVWVAHGSGTADRVVVDRRDGIDVRSLHCRSYRLRRVWLDAREERQYYYGFANEGLWPLCHRVHVQPIFRSEDFNTYQSVNLRFADAVCEEAHGDSPIVLVQDYHFALAPQAIRRRLPGATIVAFWHIPWPHARDFVICPWGRELLAGLLDSDIVGFQTSEDCENFIDTIERSLGVHVDERRNIIARAESQTMVRAYPVSVDWPGRWTQQLSSSDHCRADVCRELGLPPDVRLVVGVDRLDYTKGIVEKCLTVERLLESHPELRGRFVFVQIAEPSRECLSDYMAYRSRLRETAERVNLRFGTNGYRPIQLLEAHHEPADVFRFLRAADVCYVGSLHDGMNLVAKEFAVARDDERGALVLSRFAGAAYELTGALIVNPYAVDETAGALADALDLTEAEQSRRMRDMRFRVAEFNTYRWARELLKDAVDLSAEHAPSTRSLGCPSTQSLVGLLADTGPAQDRHHRAPFAER